MDGRTFYPFPRGYDVRGLAKRLSAMFPAESVVYGSTHHSIILKADAPDQLVRRVVRARREAREMEAHG